MSLNELNRLLMTCDAMLGQHITESTQDKEVKFYTLLQTLSKELMTCNLNLITSEDTYATGAGKALLNEAIDVLGELITDLKEVLSVQYNALNLRHVFELLDGDIEAVEGIIEDFNEYHSEVGLPQLPYLESWDIGFFFE